MYTNFAHVTLHNRPVARKAIGILNVLIARDVTAGVPFLYGQVVIGMTQVVLHYAHTFEIFMFDFKFQSGPTFDTSD